METVLLVDDNASVRSIVRQMLERFGYSVLEAGGEAELVELLEEHPVDLLLTDLMLKQSDGAQLARHALARRPGLRVLYISGYPRSFLDGYGVPAEAGFLQKPFTAAVLAQAVREALAEGAAGLPLAAAESGLASQNLR